MSELNLLDDAYLQQAAECLKVLAHPARLKIVDILMQGSFTVAQIAQISGLTPNHACEHLRLLKGHKLLSSTRKGRKVYYEIIAPQLPGLINCIENNCPGPNKRRPFELQQE